MRRRRRRRRRWFLFAWKLRLIRLNQGRPFTEKSLNLRTSFYSNNVRRPRYRHDLQSNGREEKLIKFPERLKDGERKWKIRARDLDNWSSWIQIRLKRDSSVTPSGGEIDWMHGFGRSVGLNRSDKSSVNSPSSSSSSSTRKKSTRFFDLFASKRGDLSD